MEKIISAEELLKSINPDCVEDCHKAMIEFAKLHVTEALKQASEKAETKVNKESTSIIVNKDSILNAYPLDLIE